MTKLMRTFLVLLAASLISISGGRAYGDNRTAQSAQKDSQAFIVQEIRHRLVLLPHYNLFDWLEGELSPEGVVTLRGEVVKPATKSDAEAAVRGIEGVEKVENEIEVLPLSNDDEQLRVVLYRVMFAWSSPLFRYATQAVPSIHIIVRNSHVTLKGVVANAQDSDIAYMKANGVSGIFDVKNELKIENAGPK